MRTSILVKSGSILKYFPRAVKSCEMICRRSLFCCNIGSSLALCRGRTAKPLLNELSLLPKQTFIAGNIIVKRFVGNSQEAKTDTASVGAIIKKVTESNAKFVSPNSKTNEAKEKQSNKDNSWFSGKNAWKLGLLSLGGFGISLGGFLLFTWGSPARDEHNIEIVDEFTSLPKWKAYPKRALLQMKFYHKMIQEPFSRKLLPDPLKEPYYQPPYTLVIELTGVLVHPVWSLSTGWRFKKRPGVELFLQQVTMPLFEVVIYTHEQGLTAFPIVDALDPNGFVTYRLFRESTRYVNGEHIKDLDCLNRDLSKVILVDCTLGNGQRNTRNAIVLPKWTGEDSDRTLFDLAAFLRTIAMSGVDDVRKVLDHYNQYDNPLEEFVRKQQQLAQLQQYSKSDTQAKDKKVSASSFAKGLTGWKK